MDEKECGEKAKDGRSDLVILMEFESGDHSRKDLPYIEALSMILYHSNVKFDIQWVTSGPHDNEPRDTETLALNIDSY